MSKQAMDKVFDLLDQIAKLGNGQHYGNSIGNTLALDAIAALKEAIKQHDAEPVAWRYKIIPPDWTYSEKKPDFNFIGSTCALTVQPLFASPQPTKGDA